jgi:hypothetical protein
MGWGTFIASRTLRTSGSNPAADWQRRKKILNDMAEDELFLQNEVLKAIQVLKSQGIHNDDINKRELRNSLKFYYKKKNDPKFKLNVVRQAQDKALKGERVQLEHLELLEIQRLYKQMNQLPKRIILLPFLPYYKAWKLLQNFLFNRGKGATDKYPFNLWQLIPYHQTWKRLWHLLINQTKGTRL